VGARFLCLLVKINSTCLLHWHGTLAPTPQRRKPIQTLALGRAHTRCKPSKSCLYNYMCIGTFYSQKKFVDTVRCALHKNYTEFNLKIQGNSNLDVEYSGFLFSVLLSLPWPPHRSVMYVGVYTVTESFKFLALFKVAKGIEIFCTLSHCSISNESICLSVSIAVTICGTRFHV